MEVVKLLLAVLTLCLSVEGDVYMHNPRGSNNRLNGENRERRNANRLFDSQNNNRGGYNVGDTGNVEGVGSLTYIGGSLLNIQWTNQHECGGENSGCDIILQYMCNQNIRDGTNTGTPDTRNDNAQTGRHETQDYYKDCKSRQRNHGLYHADQDLKGHSAIYTRQNNQGTRRGLECPEERDYYPYHHPNDWKDIAILTNNVKRCELYKKQSQNVEDKWYCKFPNRKERDYVAEGRRGRGKEVLAPITKEECENKPGFTWERVPAWGLAAPECLPAPKSRDNHLGNTVFEGKAATGDEKIPRTLAYTWKMPDIDEEKCVLRIRYNISIGDYEQFQADYNNDKSQKRDSKDCLPTYDIGSDYGLKPREAKDRGYEIKNNPEIKPFRYFEKLDFQLALNTAQTGRTFEDRSHRFRITRKENVPSCPPDAPVHNLNVMGKRGNIVQVYPAVEYGFEPAILKVQKGHCIHAQWTGSLRNPRNNDGEGREKEDKSNMVTLTDRTYKTNKSPAGTLGHPGNSYPLKIDSKPFLGLDKETAAKFAFPTKNDAYALPVASFAAEVVKVTSSSTFQNRDYLWGPKFAVGKSSPKNTEFFHSNYEVNPWLTVEIKPKTISSITVINRKDGGGERFRNIEVHAGVSANPANNPVVGKFKGPGYTKGEHVIAFDKPTLAKYITIQIKDPNNQRQILQINGLLFNAVDFVKSHGCIKEKGFCVHANGRDQNSGVVKLDSEDADSKEAQQSCLDRCKNYNGATGCEAIWQQGNRGCYVHTRDISRGNGVDRHMCWVFSKCVDPSLFVTDKVAPKTGGAGGPQPGPTVQKKVAYISNPKGCYFKCGKRGPCPGFCKEGGYCCRRNMGSACPEDMKAVALMSRSRCISYQTDGEPEEPEEEKKKDNIQIAIPVPDRISDVAEIDEKISVAEKSIGSSVVDDEQQNVSNMADQVQNDLENVDEKLSEIMSQFDDEVVEEIEIEKRRAQNGDASKLDNAPAYVNIPPVQMNTCATYNYLCTRNNNFSNRSQKGKVIVTGC